MSLESLDPATLAQLDQINAQTREAVLGLVDDAREVLDDVGSDRALVVVTGLLEKVDQIGPGRMCTLGAQALLLLAERPSP